MVHVLNRRFILGGDQYAINFGSAKLQEPESVLLSKILVYAL